MKVEMKKLAKTKIPKAHSTKVEKNFLILMMKKRLKTFTNSYQKLN